MEEARPADAAVIWVAKVMIEGSPQVVHADLALFGGAVVVLIASAIGFADAFTMDSTMGEMSLHGMALSQMPEMYFLAAGLISAIVGATLRGRTGIEKPAGRKGFALVAVIGTAALTIDVSKTSTLGFVIPGMRAEYGLTAGTASLLAVSGLTGAALGAVLFGVFANRIGRRHLYLVATLGFTATSMCGSMPDFAGNLVMCGLMGTAVGGLAPLLITLLAETADSQFVVALSVVATAVGYLVAAGSALWLEPIFGWRVLWLIGAPTGAVMVALTPLVPNFTQPEHNRKPLAARAFTGKLQCAYAVLIGVLTFGLTTWVPSLARLGGVPVSTANLLLTAAAVVMVPCAVLLMMGYRRFGPVTMACGLATVTAVLLLALTASGAVSTLSWVCAAALVAALFSVNTMAAIFLPIAAELADPLSRGRAIGTVSLFNRLGGLCGPLLLAGLVSSAADVLVAVGVLALLCAGAAWHIGRRHHRELSNWS